MNTCVITKIEYDRKDYRALYIFDESRHAIEILPEQVPYCGLMENVYVGRIEKMSDYPKACFVRIDAEKSVYLPLDDSAKIHYVDKKSNGSKPHQGDLILVKVKKDEVRSKDAVGDSEISISSYHLECYLEQGSSSDCLHVGVSRKLSPEERKRLTDLFASGFSSTTTYAYRLVIRSNADGIDGEVLLREAEALFVKMDKLMESAHIAIAPQLLWKAPSPIEARALHFRRGEVGRVVTDDPALWKVLNESNCFIVKKDKKTSIRDDETVLEYYTDPYPLSMLYSLLSELENALKKTVWLSSGASLVIEATEAMYVIDVNSSHRKSGGAERYGTNGKNGDPALQANLELVPEIARQIRLRNLTGMILVDFMNMKTPEAGDLLLKMLRRETKSDPISVHVVDITELGIVEITRKKQNPSLKQMLTGTI